MNRQTERYQGRFAAPRKPARRLKGGLLALVVLLLFLVRGGAGALKLMGYADVLLRGGRMLIYGDVQKVEIGKELNGIPVVTAPPEDPTGEYILQINDGTTIVYNGHTYELNRNLATVLFLGIDNEIHDTEVIGTAGQSDVMLLIAIDTKTGETKLLNIPRDAYAQVEVYSVDGKYIESSFQQITLAYAYGNGKDSSCENAMRSVSRLLYGLPIGSYLALDMTGIQAANEAVGGVTVSSLIEMRTAAGSTIQPGDRLELHGRDLDRYIRTRGHDLEANRRRMERQVQYVTEFSKLAVAKSRQSLSFPVDLFSSLAPYMVSNLDIQDVTFLSSTYLSHGAEFSLRSIDGSFDKLNGSTVCYLDEMDLFEAVLELFYRQTD